MYLKLSRCYQVLFQAFDLRNAAVRIFYSEGSKEKFDREIDSYLNEGCVLHYNKFEGWLRNQGKKFMVRDEGPTTADFHVRELLDQHELFGKWLGKPNLFLVHEDGSESRWPLLKEYYQRFKELEGVKRYMQTGKAALPVNNKSAFFK